MAGYPLPRVFRRFPASGIITTESTVGEPDIRFRTEGGDIGLGNFPRIPGSDDTLIDRELQMCGSVIDFAGWSRQVDA